MNSSLVNRRIAEGHGKAAAVVPGVELVLVVRAEHLARFAKSNVLDRMVEIREIDDHAHARTVPGCGGFDCGGSTCLRECAGIQQPAQKR